MDVAALQTLIKDGETQTVEFKIAPPRPGELAERLCGLANSSSGGMIMLGVADKTWDIAGVKSVPEACDIILQATRLCKPTVPLIPSQPQIIEIDGKKLVAAHVPSNDGTLYQAGGVYWLRRGTRTGPMETSELVRFLYRQGTLEWELQPVVKATLDDLNMEKVREYIEKRTSDSRRPVRLADPVELLVKLDCAVEVEDARGKKIVRPTNAGLLLFGHSPRDFLTQAEVVTTFYQDSSGVRRYTDRKIFSGTIADQIDQAAEYLRLLTPVGAHIEGFRRVDEPALPLEALREAVVNALVHRDYSLAGTAVRIFYYPDRMEIYNPGLLLPGLNLEQLQEGKVSSRPRNPVIASVMRDLPGGYMERVGSGIRFMINQMRAAGLPDPQFKEQDEFVVTFLRTNQTVTPALGTQSELPAYLNKPQPAPAAIPTGPGTPTALEQSQRLEIALQYVREHGSLTHKLYRALTGASETTAIRDLDLLVNRNALRRLGKGPSRRYVI